VTNIPINILPVGYPSQSHGQSSYSSDDLPKALVMTLNQGSPVKSMDFHPVEPILLLVGTNTGEIMVWDLVSRDRLAHRSFKVWNIGAWSMALQASLANDYTASINRVIWSPDGTLIGVAYSKHIVHIYSYQGGDDLIRNHLEIEAHVGSVNDLAFSYPNKQLSIVTCGEDRLIKVWDAVTGIKSWTACQFGADSRGDMGVEGNEGGSRLDIGDTKKNSVIGGNLTDEAGGDFLQGRRRQAFPASGNRSATFR
ncbi:unnamed protein product, partial [Ilex paraguariensis]